MAEIIAKFNTVDKTIEVTEDGKKVKDFCRVVFEKYGENAHMTMECGKHDEEHSMTKMLNVYAQQYIGQNAEMDKFLDDLIKKVK